MDVSRTGDDIAIFEMCCYACDPSCCRFRFLTLRKQINGGALTLKSDVFSLGSVLWEVSTASIPFSGKDDLDRIRADINRPPPKLRPLGCVRLSKCSAIASHVCLCELHTFGIALTNVET